MSDAVVRHRRSGTSTLRCEALPQLILPVRSLAGGKTRLAAVLDAAARRALNEDFLRHLLDVARRWPGLGNCVVVSPDPEVLRMARNAGAQTLMQSACPGLDTERSESLNAGLDHAAGVLRARGSCDLLVVSCDTPHASATDLRRMHWFGNGSCGARSVVIATDRHGEGTNALWLPAEMPAGFHFGPGSRQRHVQMAGDCGFGVEQLRIAGLALDIDTPADLCTWRRLSQTPESGHLPLSEESDG